MRIVFIILTTLLFSLNHIYAKEEEKNQMCMSILKNS